MQSVLIFLLSHFMGVTSACQHLSHLSACKSLLLLVINGLACGRHKEIHSQPYSYHDGGKDEINWNDSWQGR